MCNVRKKGNKATEQGLYWSLFIWLWRLTVTQSQTSSSNIKINSITSKIWVGVLYLILGDRLNLDLDLYATVLKEESLCSKNPINFQ